MSRRIRKAHEAPDRPWTLIGPGGLLHGDLLVGGDVIVHGRVEGTIFTDGEVRIAHGGAVVGGIHAVRVLVEGLCEGRIEAVENTVIRSGALVRGEIASPALTVEPGARYIGDWLQAESPQGPKIRSYMDSSPGQA